MRCCRPAWRRRLCPHREAGWGWWSTYTTEEVLTELLNYFGARGPYFRTAASRLVERMRADPSIQILPQSHEGFLAGIGLYQARPDKGYSLTDCISMETMRREGLSEVLTNDEHFAQEGLTCLLAQ